MSSVYQPYQAIRKICALAKIDVSGLSDEELLSESIAAKLDDADELAAFRAQFHIPRANPNDPSSPEAVYLCGNSLGLQPANTQKYIIEELEKWRTVGVEGHFTGRHPWVSIDEPAEKLMAKIVGAADVSEVAIMNSLSANLHLLLTAFYRPTPERYKILMEDGAFCSDYHVIRSQIELHGFETDGEKSAIVALKPREGETYIRTEDIVDLIQREGDSIATVLIGGVQFYSGQAFDMETITRAAHAKGIRVGFDLAHAAGNLDLRLHDWNVDFAAWCTYKYLNCGPGCLGGIFVHSRLNEELKKLPKLCGWWGQSVSDRFAMQSVWQGIEGAQAFKLSNPPVVAAVSMYAALELHNMATMPRLRAKSEKLTGYLEALLAIKMKVKTSLEATKEEAEAKDYICQLTPRDPTQRGCQLSLRFNCNVSSINHRLLDLGVYCDVRKPNVLRVSPTPLYNTFKDAYHFVQRLERAVRDAE